MVTEKKTTDSATVRIDEEELEVFVTKTLKAVVRGIAEADKYTRPLTGIGLVINEEGRIPFAHQLRFNLPEKICFDVAVNVVRKSGKGGGLKIEVMNVGGHLSSDAGREQSVASRVSFEVPVEWKNKQG